MTATLLTFNIPLDQLQNVLALYDHMQVWRSTTGSSGTYTEITGSPETAAVAKSTTSPPWAVSGLVLNVSLSSADPVAITFHDANTGPGPLRIEDVVQQINLAIPGLAKIDPDDNAVFDLTNPLTGTGSTILLTGNALVVFGLPSTLQSGVAPRILIGLLNTQYKFTDLGGDPTYWYKTRYWSSKTNAVSAFSTPQQANPSQVLANGSLVLATVDLVSVTGAPVVGRRIIIVPVVMQQFLNGSIDYGLLPSSDRIELTTDASGHAQTNLVVGSTIRVFFEGSGYSRECVVPAAQSPATSIDLLAILSTQPDPFSIVQAPPMPIREG